MTLVLYTFIDHATGKNRTDLEFYPNGLTEMGWSIFNNDLTEDWYVAGFHSEIL